MTTIRVGVNGNRGYTLEFDKPFDDIRYSELHDRLVTEHGLTDFRIIGWCLVEDTEGGPAEPDFYCADWDRCGTTCETQCPRCRNTTYLNEVG